MANHARRLFRLIATSGVALSLLPLCINGLQESALAQDSTTPELAEPSVETVQIPAENRADLSEPSERPGVGDTEARAEALFNAIMRDQPELARDFFFPRAPFSRLKGIADPDRYWNVLYRHYERDIHALHEELPEGAVFDRFVLRRRGGWVERRQEANALPYWAARHCWIYYRVEGRERRFEVRTLINWGPRWFVTHLR